jgi:hypothetical protein
MVTPPPCDLCNHWSSYRFFHRMQTRHTRLRSSGNFQNITRGFRHVSSRHQSVYVFFTRFCPPRLLKWPPGIINSTPHALYPRITCMIPLRIYQRMKSPFPLMHDTKFTPDRTKVAMKIHPPHSCSAPPPRPTEDTTSRLYCANSW